MIPNCRRILERGEQVVGDINLNRRDDLVSVVEAKPVTPYLIHEPVTPVLTLRVFGLFTIRGVGGV
jgi:hypothetical protein